jgi:hypothetical protein
MAWILTVGSAIGLVYNTVKLINYGIAEATKARLIQIINARGFSEE